MTIDKLNEKREKEKQMVGTMITIYCKGNHGTNHNMLCEKCQELKEYAWLRTDKCPFMETKSFCNSCSIHCYNKEMKQRVKDVMRYAGPRMIYMHPVIALKHMVNTVKYRIKRGKN